MLITPAYQAVSNSSRKTHRRALGNSKKIYRAVTCSAGRYSFFDDRFCVTNPFSSTGLVYAPSLTAEIIDASMKRTESVVFISCLLGVLFAVLY